MGALGEKALPGLASALEALAAGEQPRIPVNELADLKAAVRPLEAALAGDWEPERLDGITALVDASRQVARLAASVEAVARLDSNRLEELVEVRIGALAQPTATWSTPSGGAASCSTAPSGWPRRNGPGSPPTCTTGPSSAWPRSAWSSTGAACASTATTRRAPWSWSSGPATELSEEIRSLRQMMSELRPPILDEGGLEAALRDHLSAWSAAYGDRNPLRGHLARAAQPRTARR